MIKKRETCLYCGKKMESITAKKKFCSALHKLYWHREFKRGTLEPHQLEDKNNFKKEPELSDEAEVAVSISKNSMSIILHNQKINKQISEIENEKIPKDRDTSLGRRIWNVEQYKKIEELRKQLK